MNIALFEGIMILSIYLFLFMLYSVQIANYTLVDIIFCSILFCGTNEGLMQQIHTENDNTDCLHAYCRLVGTDAYDECKHKNQIKTIVFAHHDARGPQYAHHIGEQLMGDEEFCMQADSHR